MASETAPAPLETMSEPMLETVRRPSPKEREFCLLTWRRGLLVSGGVVFVALVVALILMAVHHDASHGKCHGGAAVPEFPSSTPRFFLLSDVHIDPLFNATVAASRRCRDGPLAAHAAPFGRPRCDAPWELFDSTLDAMARSVEDNGDVEFILITGDLVAHHLEEIDPTGGIKIATMREMAARIRKRLPNVPVFPAFGNNDVPADYVLPDGDSWLQKMLDVWGPLIVCDGCGTMASNLITMQDLESTYMEGGWWELQVTDSWSILFVNTLLYTSSSRVATPTAQFVERGRKQMAWIEERMEALHSAKKSVWLAGHIAPSTDPHSGPAWKVMWKDEFVREWQRIFGKYGASVSAAFFGHIHKDDYHIFHTEDDDVKLGIMVNPSVTPVYSANPSYRYAYVDEAGEGTFVADWRTYYMDLAQANAHDDARWRFMYSWQQDFTNSTQPHISTTQIVNMWNRINDPADLDWTWQRYIRHRQAMFYNDPIPRYHLWCAMNTQSVEAMEECVREHPWDNVM